MSRHLLQRLIVLAAFAVALLVPMSARAAIVPVCELDLSTRMPRMPVIPALAFAAAEDVTSPCDDLTDPADEDGGDPKVAAFCDARGASAIAPQRVVPINDAELAAAPSCARLDISTQSVGPSQRDGLAVGSTATLPDPAALADAALVGPASSTLLPAYGPLPDVDLPGALQAVYHPPR